MWDNNIIEYFFVGISCDNRILLFLYCCFKWVYSWKLKFGNGYLKRKFCGSLNNI